MKKRMIGLPKTTATLAPNQSTISGGTSSLLPTDTATNKLATPKAPSSVTNPASLTPGTTVKSFSDNMTKPILDTPKVTTPAPVATPPVTGQAVAPATTPPAVQTAGATTPQYSESLYDPNNYLGSGKTKDQFMAMDVADQTNLINQGVQNVEERQAIMDQVKTYAENKAQQEYATKQQGINTQQQTSQNNIAQVQASQRIQEAQTNLDNLKQNLGFLGTGGRPVKSATAIEGASRLLIQSEQTFQQLKQVEEEYKSLRQSGVEFNANQFEEQMRRLQKDLTDSVDASIIQAMSGFDAEGALASIDNQKKLFELQQKYLDMVDTSVEGITNRQVNEMKNLQTRYADYAKQYAEDLKQEKENNAKILERKNTLNEPMSKAYGVYVNGNGELLRTTDGQTIQYKNDADKPIIDWNTGKVAYFNTDANGNQVVEIKQLFTPEMKAPDVKKIGTDASGKDIYGTFNTQTGGYEPIPGITATMGGGMGDLRGLASQYPGQARAKNNNPAGMKSSISDRTKQLMVDAGVQRATGSTPPPNEGGRYMQFATIEDGLLAHKVLLTSAGSDDINARLQQRVGTAEGPRYAAQLMGQAGIPNGTKFSELSEDQLNKLLFAQIQKESPGLAKVLQSQSGAGDQAKLLQQATALVAGMSGTGEERANYANMIAQTAAQEGISVQDAKAKLGIMTKTDDSFIDVRKKDRDKIQEGGKSLTQVKGAIQALNDPNPTTDLIGIVGLLKSIDPASVARSDEVQNVKKAAGVLEAAETQLKSWKSGDLLSQKQREQLQKAMQTIVDTYERGTEDKRKQIVKDFDKRGIDANIIFGTNEIASSRSGIANEIALQAAGVGNTAANAGGSPYSQYQKR